MIVQVQYGAAAPATLELPPDSLLAACQAPSQGHIGDPAAAIAAAVADPLDFPPVEKAVVPGDRVVIALDDDLPHEDELVAGLVGSLLTSGVEAEQIAVLRPAPKAGEAGEEPTRLLPGEVRSRISVLTHDPHDAAQLSYVAASKDAQPVYFNRSLADADVVLPISTVRLGPAPGHSEGHTGLFPQYSDQKTRNRFAAPASTEFDVHQRRRSEEADEAAWLLGVQVGVQVVPGPAGELLHLLAGGLHATTQTAERISRAAWNCHLPRRSPLVVAAIDAPATRQSWAQFSRALQAAAGCVEEGGTIVICSQLAEPPGEALAQLVSAASPHEVLSELRRSRAGDAATASLLARTLLSHRVFLLSRLPEETVEQLGMGYVADEAELRRLCGQFPSAIVLASAQHLVPVVANGVTA